MFTTIRRVTTALMAFAVVVSSFAFGGTSALAQSSTSTNVPGKWASAILIQNVGSGALNSGQYSIAFYDANGGTTPVTTYSPTDQILVGSSKEFYVPSAVSALSAGQYSAIISSAQKVKAVVNSSTDSGTTGPWSAFSYEGVDADSAKSALYFPAFYRNYYTFRSELVIQNTGATAATIRATFYQGTTGAKTVIDTLPSIPANASRTYSWDNTALAGLLSGNSGIYGVVIESTNAQNLAGISNIWSSDSTNYGVASYNAFTDGSKSVYAGALYNQYYGFVSSITVQNIEATDTSVTISYSDGKQDTFTVPANQSRERFQPNLSGLSSGNTAGLLSATVTSTTSKVVAIVNIQRKARGSVSAADPSNPAFGSYSATTTTPTTSLSVPAIFSDYYGYFTAVSVKNTTDSTVSVTLSYGNGKPSWTQSAGPGATVNFSHLPNVTSNPLSKGTQTSGTVSSTVPLVVVIQHNTDSSLSSYRPAKAPNDFLFVLSGFPN